MRWWRVKRGEPKAPTAVQLREAGTRALAKGRTGEAISLFEDAIRLEPGNFKGRVNLASAYYVAGQRERAVPHLRYVLALDENHPTALLNLAACLDALGEVEESIECLQKLVASRPEWKDGHYNLAIALLKTGDRSGAEASLRRELSNNPAHRGARELLGRLALASPTEGLTEHGEPPDNG